MPFFKANCSLIYDSKYFNILMKELSNFYYILPLLKDHIHLP